MYTYSAYFADKVTGSLAEKIRSVHDGQSVGESSSATASPAPESNGTSPSPGVADTNGQQMRAGIALADLVAQGKLPSLPRKSASPRAGDTVAQTPYRPVAFTGAGASEPTTTIRLELPPVDKQLLAKTIAEIRKLGVHSDVSRGSTNVLTILLKGPVSAVEQGRRIVDRQLAPRVTAEIVIPASARSAVIGSRGATLKNITALTDTKINVDSTPLPREGWSLPLVSVEIVGSHKGVQEAECMIADLVNNLVMQDEREIPDNLKLFAKKFAADRGLTAADAALAVQLSAKFSELQAAEKALDDYIATCAAEFVAKEIEGAIHPAASADLLFADHNVVIADGKLYGPAEQLDAAASALEEYLAALEVLELDISKAHGRDVEHAARLAEFLELSGAIAQLEAAHNVRVNRQDLVYHISGEDKAVLQQAKKALVAAVAERVPASLVAFDAILSEFGRLETQRLAHVLHSRSKEPAVAYVTEDGRVIVAYDFETAGNNDFGPSTEEIADALAKAAAPFNAVAQRELSLVTEQVPISKADFRHLQSPVGSAKKRLADLVEKGGVRTVGFTLSPEGDSVIVSGMSEDVKAVVSALPGLVAESKREQELSNYTQKIQFDPKLVKNLVGRQGATITKIRDTYKCKIETTPEGEVTVRGREEAVHQAVQHIAKLEKEFKNHKVEELHIPRQYHSILIGAKGRFVRRMQDRYNVHVKFPARYDTPVSGSEDGTASVSSENQGTDVILLSGPSQGVAATKKEFEDLVAYEKSHSFSRVIDVPVEHVPRIIGRHGAFINNLRASRDISIDVVRNEGSGAQIVIRGLKADVESAHKDVEAEVSRLADQVEKVLVVDPKYHRYLTGQGNSVRNQIVVGAGGDADLAGRTLRIPSSSSGSNEVRISGPSKLVEAIAAKVEAIVEEQQARSKFRDTITVPTNRVRFVIGTGGSAKRQIESDLGVLVDVPNSKTATTEISLRGRSEADVEAAKRRVQEMVSFGEQEVLVPAHLEYDVYDRGALKSQLESEYGVRLSMARRPPNARPMPQPPAEAVTAAGAASSAPFYATAPLSSSTAKEPVRWTLAGKDEQSCKRASEAVQAAIDEHAKHDTAGFLWLPSSSSYSKIIGPGGSVINDVRDKSGCQIVIPKQSGAGQPVSIRGSSEGVEHARQLLLALAELA